MRQQAQAAAGFTRCVIMGMRQVLLSAVASTAGGGTERDTAKVCCVHGCMRPGAYQIPTVACTQKQHTCVRTVYRV